MTDLTNLSDLVAQAVEKGLKKAFSGGKAAGATYGTDLAEGLDKAIKASGKEYKN